MKTRHKFLTGLNLINSLLASEAGLYGISLLFVLTAFLVILIHGDSK